MIDIGEKRKLVTELINSFDGILESQWLNISTVEVTIDPEWTGIPSKDSAEKQAELLARLTNSVTHEFSCVRIITPNKEKLASKCINANYEFVDDGVTITNKQLNIAKNLRTQTRIIKRARWIEKSTLEITIRDYNEQKDFNRTVTAMIGERVHEELRKRICVKLISTEKKDLEYECFGQDEHI